MSQARVFGGHIALEIAFKLTCGCADAHGLEPVVWADVDDERP
jgi:hypothetical protein